MDNEIPVNSTDTTNNLEVSVTNANATLPEQVVFDNPTETKVLSEEQLNLRIRQKILRKMNRLASKPKPGYAYNPLVKIPRNNPCPCQSGKKFKRCCLEMVPKIVSAEDAQKFSALMKYGVGNIRFRPEEPIDSEIKTNESENT